MIVAVPQFVMIEIKINSPSFHEYLWMKACGTFNYHFSNRFVSLCEMRKKTGLAIFFSLV